MSIQFIKIGALALATAFLVASPAAFAKDLPENQNNYKSVDNDTIDFATTAGDAGKIRVCLTSDLTWWKGVKVFGLPGGELGLVETQDRSKGPNCATFDDGEFAPNYTKIELLKAKAFGVHTGIETLNFDPRKYSGKTISVRWKTD